MSVHSDLGPPTDPMEKTIAALALSPDSAINSTSNFEDGPKEHVLEPVSNFPGAYPGDFDQSDTFTADDAKKAAIGVLHTAAQYIPTQQDVEKAMLSASEKAKQYLPSVVTSYLPSSTSTIHDKVKRKEELTGVGDLCEEDEMKLPDERNHRSTTEMPSLHVPNDVGSTIPSHLPDQDSFKASESDSVSNTSTQTQARWDTVATVTSPSTTLTPHSALATSMSTDGTVNKDTTPDLPQLAPLTNNDPKSPDSIPVTLSEKEGSDISNKDIYIAEQPLVNTTPRADPLTIHGAESNGVRSLAESTESLENEAGTGVNETRPAKTNTQDATAHHATPSMQPITVNADRNSIKADAGHLTHKRDGSTSSNTSGSSRKESKSKLMGSSGGSSAGSPHRSRFMDKIKGEVKVISGKLAHNEEKVEEGRRLMGKAA